MSNTIEELYTQYGLLDKLPKNDRMHEAMELAQKLRIMSRYGCTSSAIIDPYSSFKLFSDKELLHWLSWVNKNICHQMVVDTCVTTDVKVRIATGKLNKIKSLTDEEGIQIHRNLIENLKKLSIEVDLERLPF